jgi:hypothetical protein
MLAVRTGRLPRFVTTAPRAEVIAKMPTLFRLVFTLGVLAGIAYGSMFALVTFVEPEPREMTERVRLDDIVRR